MYLADGTKVLVRDNAGNGFEYFGSLVYKRQGDALSLESTSFAGGRFVAEQTQTGIQMTPYYYLTDHLGSVRVIVNADGKAKERNDYYAFGSQWESTDSQAPDNRYLYNGKEKQVIGDIGWLDYGARMYDPELGRWNMQDPMAEKKYYFSPYHFNQNNPINRIDMDGKIDWPLKGSSAVNKKDYPDGAWTVENAVVRTSLYAEERTIGTSPHIGIDYRASIGTSVYSLGDGIVNNIGSTKSGIKYITIMYKNGDRLRFMHMDNISEDMHIGGKVAEGQIIGEAGNSGKYRKGDGSYVNYLPHLHVDAKDKNGESINPENQQYGTIDNKTFFEKYEGNYQKLKEAKQDAIDKINEAGLDDNY